MSSSEDAQKVEEFTALIGKGAGYDTIMDGLAFLAEQGIRKPDLEVRWGKLLLAQYRSKLGDRVWNVYERTYLAALDAHDGAARKECLVALMNKFPGSTRVGILNGMGLEAAMKYNEALDVFSEIIKEDPSNQHAHKRKVCVLKAQGETEKAISALNLYLKTFASDASAWDELCELYQAAGKYSLAKFCLEELLLLNPENYAHHLHYAEILYTLKQFTEARAYFAQALELKPRNNLRSLYGLCVCIRVKGKNNLVHAELFKYTAERLVAEYRTAFPEEKSLNRSNILSAAEPTETEGPAPPHLVGMLRTVLQA